MLENTKLCEPRSWKPQPANIPDASSTENNLRLDKLGIVAKGAV